MTKTEFRSPSIDEIHAIECRAHEMRAAAMRDMLRAAAQWLTHPGFGVRHA